MELKSALVSFAGTGTKYLPIAPKGEAYFIQAQWVQSMVHWLQGRNIKAWQKKVGSQETQKEMRSQGQEHSV